MPRSPVTRFTRMCLMVLLMTPFVLTGCGSEEEEREPTAAEAGATLRSHILQLLKEVNAKDIQVTDSGDRDISCGTGKAKRTFAANGEDSTPHRAADSLNNQMIGALQRIATYEITDIGDPNKFNEPITMTNESTRTLLVLQSSRAGQFSVRGETECLNPS